MTDQYVNPKTARASYRPKNVMSPGLRRAREPFRLRNALTGAALAAFSVGVWAYSIGAVKQDAFDDVDEEARALMAGSGLHKVADEAAATGAGNGSRVSEAAEVPSALAGSSTPAPPPLPTTSPVSSTRRGLLLPLLEHRLPRVLDPSTGTLVWGAPPVDNVGKLGDRRMA